MKLLDIMDKTDVPRNSRVRKLPNKNKYAPARKRAAIASIQCVIQRAYYELKNDTST